MKNVLHFWFSPHGRTGRLQWWLGTLFADVVLICSFMFAVVLLARIGDDLNLALAVIGLILLLMFALAVWSHIALSVKRLHDTDNSGWTVVLVLVPFIGGLILLCLLGFKAGTSGSNHYGRSP